MVLPGTGTAGRRMAAMCSAAFVGLLSFSAHAAGLSVTPLYLTIVPGNSTAAVAVTNYAPGARVFQADVERWTQADGQDYFKLDRNALAVPVLFWILPGDTANIQVGLKHPVPKNNGREIAYRLFINEVEMHPHGNPSHGLKETLLVDLPVFLPPAHPRVQLRWSVMHEDGDDWTLRLHNAGNRHLHLLGLRAVTAGGKVLLDRSGLWYVLAGATREWPLDVSAKDLAAGVDIQAETETGTLVAKVSPRS